MPSLPSLDRTKILALAPAFTTLIFALAGTWGLVSGGAWGGIGIGGALLLALLVGLGEGRVPRLDPVCSLWVAALLTVAFASSFYAINASVALHISLKMATILLPLLCLSAPQIRAQGLKAFQKPESLALFLCIGFIWLDGVLIYQIFSPLEDKQFVISKMNRGLSYGVLLAFPLLAALLNDADHYKRQVVLLLVLLAVSSLLLTNSRATQLGILMAACVYGAARFYPVLIAWALRLGVLLSLIWPLLASHLFTNRIDLVLKLPESWLARMEIWDYMGHRILERPFFGHGIGNSHLLNILAPHGDVYIYTETPAAHPHNAVTQIWGELGLVGLGLWVVLAFWVVGAALRLPDRARAFALAAFALAYWLTMVAYNLWTDSLWAAFALVIFAFSVQQKHQKLKLP